MCYKLNTDTITSIVLTAVLAVIGYFLMETCKSVKGLEKDVAAIRSKIMVLEATRITRENIKEMIAEYHSSHPCPMGKQKRSEK
jgi:hypothetical protein